MTVQQLKEAVLKKLEGSNVGSKVAGDIWNQQSLQWDLMIDIDSVIHLYRYVNGDWQEYTRNSVAEAITKSLADCWIAEHLHTVRSSKKRTREDAAAQLPEDLDHYTKQQTHDAISRAKLEMRTEFSNELKKEAQKQMASIQELKQGFSMILNAMSNFVPLGQLDQGEN